MSSGGETSDKPVAVVTGGSRGIGRGCVLALAEAGFNIVILYRGNTDAAADTTQAVEALGAICQAIACDVANADAVTDAFSTILKTSGRIDVLVNNAGILQDGMLVYLKEDQWDEVVDTNLKGAFLCTQQVLKAMMKARSGRIINISSDSGRTGDLMRAHYGAAKAGLVGLTMSTAREVAKHGITVNAVAPGFIDTDMTTGTPEATRQKQQQLIPQGRFGSVEDVATVVAFLASAKASYITGQTLSVDGGLFMGA